MKIRFTLNNKIMMNHSWYQTLVQPPLTPPAWVFSPVWTILYITMIVSLFLYARKVSINKKGWGYLIFFTQIALNLFWPFVFFGLENIIFALVILLLLDVLVFLNIIEFFKVSKTSGRLLIPYFIWILFATYLNIGIFILN